MMTSADFSKENTGITIEKGQTFKMGIHSTPLSQFAISLERARIHQLKVDFGEKEVSILEGAGAGKVVVYNHGMPYPALYAFEELVAMVVDDLAADPERQTNGQPPILA